MTTQTTTIVTRIPYRTFKRPDRVVHKTSSTKSELAVQMRMLKARRGPRDVTWMGTPYQAREVAQPDGTFAYEAL